MKLKELGSIRNTAIGFALIILCFVAASIADAAPIDAVQDTRQPDTLCKDGLMAVGECPNGYALQDPVLNFSDLISGPDTGLGDGSGSGVIVTVWGQNLGSSQNASTIQYCDSLSVCRDGHVYYWKNADGTLPGGPANLYESHGMQEIAFSIPDSALGNGRIKVVVNGVDARTSTGGDLPFAVRTGNIYHVTPTGNNANNCSFAAPCATVDSSSNGLGNGRMTAGDVVYSHGVSETGSCGGGTCTGMFLQDIYGTFDDQVMVVGYPNTLSTITSDNRGFYTYTGQTSRIGISKYRISVGVTDPSVVHTQAGINQHIKVTGSRYIANHLIQNSGTCVNGYEAAIVSNGISGDRAKVFGNHIEALGCDNATKFQHTMYMSNRGNGISVEAWEIGYNYLKDNNTIHGIHNYDVTYDAGDCSFDVTGTIKVHNNVVINQRGAAINVANQAGNNTVLDCWSANVDVYNNVLIAAGQGEQQEGGTASADGIRIFGNFTSTSIKVRNNILYGYGETSSLVNDAGNGLEIWLPRADPTVTVENNVFVQTLTNVNTHWLNTTETITANKNLFWNTVTQDGNSPPDWIGNIIADPLLTQTGAQLSVGTGSPLIDAGLTPPTDYDIYGALRGTTIGAVEE